MEEVHQPGESLHRADFHHLDFAGRAFDVRDSGELSENAAGDCGEHRRRTDPVAPVFRQMADYCQRVYQRHQRGNFASFAGVLALRGVQHRVDYLEICFAGEGPAHLESFQLRDFGDAVSRSRNGGELEHSVGQLSFAHDRDLGAGVGDYLAAPAISYHGNLCGVVPGVCFFAQLDDRKSLCCRKSRRLPGRCTSCLFFS